MFEKMSNGILSTAVLILSFILIIYMLYRFVKSNDKGYLRAVLTLSIIFVLTIISSYNSATKLNNSNTNHKSGTIKISSDIIQEGQFNSAQVWNEIKREVSSEISEDISISNLYRINAQLKYENDKINCTSYQFQLKGMQRYKKHCKRHSKQ